MTSGLDTTFLVEAEVLGHPNHEAARRLLVRTVERDRSVALAPQVLAEFIHIVTDPRRFETPLSVGDAVRRASRWWEAKEVRQVFPNGETMRVFSGSMLGLGLGRKRILDSMLAATYLSNEISSIITSNSRDFEMYEGLRVISPTG